MGGLDSFYTPEYLADQLVSHVMESGIHAVADFCVGDGRLLTAVRRRFPNAQFFGMDIDKEVISNLAVRHSDWILEACDFLDEEQVEKIIRKHHLSFNLVLLNPPFSCKGSIINKVNCNDMAFKVSTAMMFVLKAIKYLSPNGGMYTILPVSCVCSQKDRKAWQYLEQQYNAHVISKHNRITFSGKCAPNIVLVALEKRRSTRSENKQPNDKTLSSLVVKITRGSVRMQGLNYSSNKRGMQFIHTTNLQRGKLVNVSRIIGNYNHIEHGYGVLIPRVCNPNQEKIVLIDKPKKFILSDCVIFLKTETKEHAIDVYTSIIKNWQVFLQLYSGTGAQYTTLERLNAMFPVSTLQNKR